MAKRYCFRWARQLGRILVGGVVLSCASMAAAQTIPGLYKGTTGSSVCAGAAEACTSFTTGRPVVSANVHWQISSLVGEPVVDMRVDWNPGFVANHLNPVYAKADPMLGMPGAKEAADQLRLYDAKARLTVNYGNATYTLDADLGVPGKPGGELSYNVPGIPDWSRLFRGRDGKFVDAGTAQAIFKSGAMENASAEIIKAKVDTSKFEKWWLDKNIDRYTAPLGKAIDERLAAMSDALGLPTEELRTEVRKLVANGGNLGAQARIAKLEEILFKLSPDNIPKKFLGEGPAALSRLKAYADRIAGTGDNLLAATRDLPPMPGSSESYDSWYDQVSARISRDAARIAVLQDRKDEAERLEREALAAEQRERIQKREERKRRAEQLRQRREREQEVCDNCSTASSVNDSFGSSAWGYDSYRFSPSFWTADGYLSSGGGDCASQSQEMMSDAASGASYEKRMESVYSWSRCLGYSD